MLFFATGCLLFGVVASVYALRMRNDNFSLRMNLYAERQQNSQPLLLPADPEIQRMKDAFTRLNAAAQRTTYQMQEFSYTQTDEHIIQEEP